MKIKPEKFWAVRIGNPRWHKPYLMTHGDFWAPILFEYKEEAQHQIDNVLDPQKKAPTRYKAVRVKVEVCR